MFGLLSRFLLHLWNRICLYHHKGLALLSRKWSPGRTRRYVYDRERQHHNENGYVWDMNCQFAYMTDAHPGNICLSVRSVLGSTSRTPYPWRSWGVWTDACLDVM